MGNTNCCGIGVGVPFGFEPDKPSSECPVPHPSQPLPPPHLAHLHQQQLYAQSYAGLPNAYRSHRYHLPHHHSLANVTGPPRHSLPPASSSPPPSVSSSAEDSDSIILTFQNLRHFPPEIFLSPAPSSSPSSLFLTHISSLDVCYPRVRQLVLDFNSISFVPLEIGLLRNLTELSLAGNHIASLPSSFYSLSSLTALNLGSNLLTHISPSICQLSNLTHLYLPSNRLSSLPSSLRRCERLQRISLAENRIVFADPAHVSRTAKKTSRTSSVSHAQLQQAYGITPLSHLPQSLTSSLSPFDSSFPLPSFLVFLSLSSCHLTSVPSLLPSSLSSMTHLDLSENMLRELPPDFHLLRRLRVLHLSCNDLTELLCPCEVERRRKSREREEREKKRKERDQKADEERMRERTSRGQTAAAAAAAEAAEDENVDLNDVLLLTLSPQPDEEEMTESELERDEHRDVTLSSIGSASLTSPRSSSPRQPSFSACCFPDLTSLYIDNNLFSFSSQPRASSSSFAPSPSSPSSPPALSFISPCFLPFSLRFLNVSGNPILLCKDGIADSALIRQYAMEKEKRDRKLSRQSGDAVHHRDEAAGAAATAQLTAADLSRDDRLEVENDRQRRDSGGSAPTLETVKAARKRSVSFSAVVGYSSDLAHSRRLQPQASNDQQLDDRCRHGHDVSAVLSSLSALQSFHSSLRFEYRYQLPDLIIDGVWLGCWECAKNKQGLQALHISHVLTVAQFPPLYPHVFVYKQLQVQDVVGEDVLSHLDDAVQWMHERRKEGKRLLIHCRQGISRSATVMIAYCMTYGTGDAAVKEADRTASAAAVSRREEEDETATALPTNAVIVSSSSSSSACTSPSTPGLSSTRAPSVPAPRLCPPLPPPPPVPRGAQAASPSSPVSSPLCMSYDAAFAFVASKRPAISPNDGFRAQLAAYEQLKKDRAAADRERDRDRGSRADAALR